MGQENEIKIDIKDGNASENNEVQVDEPAEQTELSANEAVEPEGETAENIAEKPEPPVIDWRDRCLRAMAELDNANKTVPKRIQEGVDRFKRGHFANLLELADGFDRALAHSDGIDPVWREGMESLHRMLIDILGRSGVKAMNAKGWPFDPNWHEVITTVPSLDAPDGSILEVVRSGWTLDGRLLRPAMVVVVSNERAAEAAASAAPEDGSDEQA
jgi:molecular chaperone GrpE